MRARGAALALTLAGAALVSPPARAADREACFSAAESAQKLRTQGRLRAARERLLVCVQTGCPSAVQSDCATWLGEVSGEVPSIVVEAHDAHGNDVADVRVLVDGTTVADRLDGRPIELDPGSHVLRLERDGSAPVDRSLLLVASQKARVVEAQMLPVGPAAGASSPGFWKNVPTPVLVLGGVGAAGLVSTAVFWAWGRADYSSLRSSCSPACSPSSVSAVRTKLVVGDASLGVAAVALGVGAWLFLTRRHETAWAPRVPSTELLVQAQPGGGIVAVGGRF
jgi:hypothetical protein